MKVITYNVNGIRAAVKKGFMDWLKEANPDVLCLQELKAMPDQIDMKLFHDLGYNEYLSPAVKKGYSGVAVFSKQKGEQVEHKMGYDDYDNEGRYVAVLIDKTLFISVYFPSGTTGEVRQAFKYKFLDDFFVFIETQKKKFERIVISGDYNIVHKPIDIHDPVGNKKSSGFLPEEREWLTKFFDSGWIDIFRHFNQEPHQYTWWSQRFNSRANNKGWRIDYHAISPALLPSAKGCRILADIVHSDHCPVELELNP